MLPDWVDLSESQLKFQSACRGKEGSLSDGQRLAPQTDWASWLGEGAIIISIAGELQLE